MHQIKLVIVGDSVGKSCLLLSFLYNKFPIESIPTIFDKYSKVIDMFEETFHVQIYDTSGHEEYDRLRPLSYHATDVVLVCFSLVDPKSFENVKTKWIPEAKHYCPKAQIILVGTQSDLLNDSETLNKLKRSKEKPVTIQEAEELRDEVKAFKFMKCSALTQDGLREIFHEAVLLGVQVQSRDDGKENCCSWKFFRCLRTMFKKLREFIKNFIC